MPMARPVTQLGCIVDNCAWTYTEPDPARHLSTNVEAVHETVVEAILQAHNWEVESAVREHLASHDVTEWARTIGRLRSVEQRAQSVARSPIPPLDSYTAGYILAGVAVQKD